MSSRLLVAVDLSKISRSAVDYAIRLAGSERVIDLLHISQPGLTAMARTHAPAELLERIESEEEAKAQAGLNELMDSVPAEHRGNILLRRGTPAETICEVAGEGYELVVVCTRGRTGLSHILIGSVAERVVRHAPVPVLVVR